MTAAPAPTAYAEDRLDLRVGIYQNAPKIFMDRNGNASGFFPDIMAAMAQHNGWQLTYVPCAWADCLDMLEVGDIDILPDVAQSAEREARFDFNALQALHSWSDFYVRRDSPIDSLTDLDGRRVAVMRGSIQHARLLDYRGLPDIRIHIVGFDTMDAVLRAVSAGEAEAGIVNTYFAMDVIDAHGLSAVGIVLYPTSLFFGISRHAEPGLAEVIDANLVVMKSDTQSAYYVALHRWIEHPEHFHMPAWASWGLLSLALLSVAGLAVSILLKRVVRARTADLQTALTSATEASQAKSDFLSNMSHDLRTPLNSIIGFSEMIDAGTHGAVGHPKYVEYIRHVRDCGQRLNEMIEALLDLSKIESGKSPLSKEWVDIPLELDMARHRFRPLIGQEDRKDLRVVVDGAPGFLWADRMAVSQIIDNLLSNALRHAGPAVNVELGWSIGADGSGKLWVADDGRGFPVSQAARLTEPFVQGGPDYGRLHTQKRLSQGFGLGLTIVTKLASLHDGHLSITSAEGQGSRFTVTFPASQVDTVRSDNAVAAARA